MFFRQVHMKDIHFLVAYSVQQHVRLTIAKQFWKDRSSITGGNGDIQHKCFRKYKVQAQRRKDLGNLSSATAMKTNLALLLIVLVQKTLGHGVMVSQESSVVQLLILYQYFPCDYRWSRSPGRTLKEKAWM